MKFRKKQLMLAVLPSVLLVASAHANTLYKCVDEDGRVSYVDAKNKGSLKSCKILSQDLPVSTVSGQRAKAPSPPNFPKVDGDTQKSRDSERRRILEQELATEQQNLDTARKALSDQEAIRSGDEKNYQRVLDRLQPFKDKAALHERNIEALKKELANLR